MNTELTQSISKLSVRARNLLNTYLPERIAGVEAAKGFVADMIREGGLRMRNCGNKTRNEIVEWAGFTPIKRVYGFEVTRKCGHKEIMWNISKTEAEKQTVKRCEGCETKGGL